ncbi:hypothetical protein JTE90_020294 [Oedothorax gibbosus]|uniref:Uncharacterized protein n=1 Tax=Oedothorax gibbosus TaxID=931172 RepID=A0AAV6VP35_9ARAC|nr:hypothetical protein JTE90_020294 [Oedothorax gibbosus]
MSASHIRLRKPLSKSVNTESKGSEVCKVFLEKAFLIPRSFPVCFAKLSGPAVWMLRHGMTSGRDVTSRNIKKSRLPSSARLRRTFPLSFEFEFIYYAMFACT